MSYNVLIVDDSAVVRRMVRKAIGLTGVVMAEIHEAGNGKEALAVLAKNWVDIIFCDINMPEMDGAQFVAQLAKDNVLAKTPVVILSSEQSEKRIEELKKLGVREYLQKPFRPETIKKVVLELLVGAKEHHGG